MGSIWDFSNSDREKIQEIQDVVKSKKGHCSAFETNVIVSLWNNLGYAKLLFVITKCMANDWHKTDRWEALASLVMKYDIERVRFGIEALNGRENHSIGMVETIIRNPKLAKRDVPGKLEPARPLVERPYPPADHRYAQVDAMRWMTEHSHSFDSAMEYFEFAGQNVYLLKPEYR